MYTCIRIIMLNSLFDSPAEVDFFLVMSLLTNYLVVELLVIFDNKTSSLNSS